MSIFVPPTNNVIPAPPIAELGGAAVPQSAIAPQGGEGPNWTPAQLAYLNTLIAAILAAQNATSPFNPYFQQASWFIDPANVSGKASDSNDGLTANTPVRSWNGGIVARWGTTSPIIAQNTTFTWLSSQPVSVSDPVIFDPIVIASIITITSPLPVASHSGVLAGVVAKNRAADQLLNANLGFAASPGMLVQNTTLGKSSFASVYVLTAGTTFALTQPLAPFVLPLPEIPIPFATELDTWANGDTFSVFQLTSVNIVRLKPTMTLGKAPNFEPPIQVQHIHFATGDGVNSDGNVEIGADVDIIECSFDSVVMDTSGSDDLVTVYANCFLGAGSYCSAPGDAATYFIGGAIIQNVVGGGASWSFDYDAIIDATNAPNFMAGAVDNNFGFQIGIFGLVYIKSTISVQGVLSAFTGGSQSGTSTIWGPGVLNVSGTSRLIYKSTTAVATFINAGGLTINGSGNANPANPATGAIGAQIALTPAHLDAAFGAPGFGGVAINFGGGSIVAATSP